MATEDRPNDPKALRVKDLRPNAYRNFRLGKMGPDAKEAVPALTAALEVTGQGSFLMRETAANSLGGIGYPFTGRAG